jgi:hypothetical protein
MSNLLRVFNAGFDEKLTPTEQRLHLLALGLVSVFVYVWFLLPRLGR